MERYVRVRVLAERFGRVGAGQRLDEFSVGLQGAVVGDVVDLERRQREVWGLEDRRAIELVQVRGQNTPVDLVRHTASVVRFRDQKLEGVERGLLVLIQVGCQKIIGHLHINYNSPSSLITVSPFPWHHRIELNNLVH